MKLPIPINHLSLCATADSDDTSFYTTTTSSNSNSNSSPCSLQSSLSLQTLPSIPSLQSLFLLETYATISDVTPCLSTSLSLGSTSPVTALSLSNGRLYAASAHKINVYDSSTLAHLETFHSDGGNVKSVTFCCGKVVTAHQDGKVRVWKLTATREGRLRHKMVVTLPTVTDRLRRFPVPKNHVRVRRHKKRLWVEHYDAVSGLAVGLNDGQLYSVSWDKSLKVWDPKLGFRCLESVTVHDDAVNAVVVSEQGTVYTGSADGRIGVWVRPGSRKRHVRVATLEKHKSAVNALALSMDGSILFSGACDRSILVWEREDSANYMVVSGALRGHDGAILCLINVSYFLISGSADRTVRIWRRGLEGKFDCLSVLMGHVKPVKSLAARMEGDDGITVFSGGLSGDIKVWSVAFNSGFSDKSSYFN